MQYKKKVKGSLGCCSVTWGRGGHPKGLNFFWEIHVYEVICTIFQSSQIIKQHLFKGLPRPFQPGYGPNNNILNVFQCWRDIRNLWKHSHMFLETSHHRNIPFWAKNIPYLEGGEGGETKGLNFFTYPRQFFQSQAPLEKWGLGLFHAWFSWWYHGTVHK